MVKQEINQSHRNPRFLGVYFSKLKGSFDEQKNYELMSNCICGGLNTIVDYQQIDCLMKFLMGFDESSIDPMSVNKCTKSNTIQRVHLMGKKLDLQTRVNFKEGIKLL